MELSPVGLKKKTSQVFGKDADKENEQQAREKTK